MYVDEAKRLGIERLLTDTDFSNIIKKSSLERLAEADDHEVVKSIVEYFADFIVINPDLCSLPLTTRLFSSSADSWNHESLTRTTEGVLAMLLALKKKPLIRYEKNSVLCRKLATEVRYAMTQEEQLFDFRKPDTPPILLLVDRRDDPVTPLLTQWTYQAMVHELLGIENGRVNLSEVPEVRPEFKVGSSFGSIPLPSLSANLLTGNCNLSRSGSLLFEEHVPELRRSRPKRKGLCRAIRI